MMRMESEDAMMAAVLHDVVEDSDWTLEQLRGEGFSEEVLQAVDCLTRRDDERYDEFVARAQVNPIARQVKIADLEDNMNVKRIGEMTPKDLARIKEYHRAWRALTQEG
jgi:(p)ppGpp synthase/HD superfamily hydrolase